MAKWECPPHRSSAFSKSRPSKENQTNMFYRPTLAAITLLTLTTITPIQSHSSYNCLFDTIHPDATVLLSKRYITGTASFPRTTTIVKNANVDHHRNTTAPGQSGHGSEPYWDYEGSDGPAHWPEKFPGCKPVRGVLQVGVFLSGSRYQDCGKGC